MRAINYHGGVANLQRHVDNVQGKYGLQCVVAINHFATDTDAELNAVRDVMSAMGVQTAICRHWEQGGKGATDLAKAVVDLVGKPHAPCRFSYEDSMTLWDKAKTLATQIYGAADLRADAKVRKEINRLQDSGFGHLPVCIAKTQYSFSTDPGQKGVPDGHIVDVKEVVLRAGAGFVVFMCGDILTMPGLPKVPAAGRIDLNENGDVIGLS
jgi:formate--tetrahydrofolate ligase